MGFNEDDRIRRKNATVELSEKEKSLLEENKILKEALKAVVTVGKYGAGGAVCVTTETLRAIAKAALDKAKSL